MRQIAKPLWPLHHPTGTRTVTALVILPPTQSNQLSPVRLPRMPCPIGTRSVPEMFLPVLCLGSTTQKRFGWGGNWMSFSFAIQDGLSPWYHIVELASLFPSMPLLLSSFLVELLSLMNGVVTETVKLPYSWSRLPCLAISWLSALSSPALWRHFSVKSCPVWTCL